MNLLLSLSKVLHNPEKIVTNLGKRGLLNWMSDISYVKLLYCTVYGKMPDLRNPKTFSEKMQWLKLHDRNPLYTILVDKYEAKEYVANIIGDEYIIPTLGIWNEFEEIDFDALPNMFVLKCTHDSGGVVICKDKECLNIKEAQKVINRCMKRNFFYFGREWPYKNVKPRIIVEKYMEDSAEKELKDYKFWCFNGKVRFCQVISNRFTNETIDFFDEHWNLLPFVGLTETISNSAFPPVEPKNYKQMITIAEKIAIDNPFSRVDLYNIDGKIYFGEVTLYPNSGLGSFRPPEWNYWIGDMVDIN